jgi:uncharacterized cupredoxin-like copper-binding protein
MCRPRFFLLLSGLVLAMLLAACGSGGTSTADGSGEHGGDGHGADSVQEPVAGAEEATVTAVDLDFKPDSIDAVAGEPLNVTVANEGKVLHDFTLEEFDFHVNVDAGETKETSLTIDEPGTYEAICTVAGHADAGMKVKVVVAE